MEAEPERDLAWSADGARVGLHHKFLIENILQVEEHIRRLVHLPGNREIDGRKATEPSGAIVRIVIVLGARVMVLSTNIHKPFVRVGQPGSAAMPRHLSKKPADQRRIR